MIMNGEDVEGGGCELLLGTIPAFAWTV